MARGPGPLTRPRPDTVAMPKRGKRLKFRAQDACSGRVTVADYANSDPAVVRSGRVKKAVANAVQQEVKSLCGLEASQVPAVEALSGAGEPCDIIDSSGETDAQEESIHERTVSRKKKSKRHRDLDGNGGEEYPMDIWLLLASYIRPEDIVNFSLICKNAWTVTCTAAFWTRLYRSMKIYASRFSELLESISASCWLWKRQGFPGGSEGKASAYNVGNLGLIPGSGTSPGEGNGNPLQYSGLENPMYGEAWWATVHGVTKSPTRLSDFTFAFFCLQKVVEMLEEVVVNWREVTLIWQIRQNFIA